MMRFVLIAVVACCLLPMASHEAWSCPMCYGDLEPDQARGFFWGIMLLGLLPFGLIAYIGGHVVHQARKKSRADLLITRAEVLIQQHQSR